MVSRNCVKSIQKILGVGVVAVMPKEEEEEVVAEAGEEMEVERKMGADHPDERTKMEIVV